MYFNIINIRNNIIKLSLKLVQLYDKLIYTEYLFIYILSIFVGILTGFAEVFLKYLINVFSKLFFIGEGKTILDRITNSPWYIVLLIPVIGIVLSQIINLLFFKKSRTHGVSQVIESIVLKNGYIKPIAPWLKALATSITIGAGGSVGPEGPAVFLGAGIASTVSQLFKANSMRTKTLVAAGAGAGIAAAFNAPIAGALFAIEIFLMDFKFQQFSVIVIATVMATFVSRSLTGDLAVFQSSVYHLTSILEFIWFGLLGIFSGIVSWLFIDIINRTEEYFHLKLHIHPIYKSIIGGILVGTMGIFLPYVLGAGYDTIDLAILNKLLWYVAFIVVIIKILTTAFTLSTGGSGGVFAPALVVGAALGAFWGQIFNFVSPSLAAKPEIFALLGMAGLLAGTMHAPFTATIMLFELTKNQDLVLPAMLTTIISVTITKKLINESIYTLPLLKYNINLKNKTELNVLESISVKDIYSKEMNIVLENEIFLNIVKRIINEKVSVLVVNSNAGNFYGLITLDTIKEILMDSESLGQLLIAGDIAMKNIPKIYLEQNLREVWEIINRLNYDALPVFNENNPHKIIGLIYRKDIDFKYNQELERFDLTSNLASKISSSFGKKTVPLFEQFVLSEINVPEIFIGKSIMELNIRNKYEVEIISIRSKQLNKEQFEVIPNGNFVFKKDDVLIVAGKQDKINVLMNL